MKDWLSTSVATLDSSIKISSTSFQQLRFEFNILHIEIHAKLICNMAHKNDLHGEIISLHSVFTKQLGQP